MTRKQHSIGNEKEGNLFTTKAICVSLFLGEEEERNHFLLLLLVRFVLDSHSHVRSFSPHLVKISRGEKTNVSISSMDHREQLIGLLSTRHAMIKRGSWVGLCAIAGYCLPITCVHFDVQTLVSFPFITLPLDHLVKRISQTPKAEKHCEEENRKEKIQGQAVHESINVDDEIEI